MIETMMATTIMITITSFIPINTAAVIIVASFVLPIGLWPSIVIVESGFYSYSRPKASKYLSHSFEISATMTN